MSLAVCPPALVRAMLGDVSHYMLGLGTGIVLSFRSASRVSDSWVLLNDVGTESTPISRYNFVNGMEVRIRDIEWVADGL